MPVRLIGMIGVEPPQGTTLHVIGGGVSAPFLRTFAQAHEAAGFDQVSHAVNEMDKVTQQNAASAEESSSAASELSGQSEELASMVGSFRLDRTAGLAPRRVA